MAAPEYKVIKAEGDELEQQLNGLAREGWRPVLLSPDSFGGASLMNSGPSRVSTYRVILVRD